MTKRFAIGFGIGLLIFIAVNLLFAHLASDCGLPAVFGRDSPWHRPLPDPAARSYRLRDRGTGQVCADDIARAGWPLQFYEEGGFAYRHNFNVLFLLINMVICIAFAVISGWLFSRSKKTLFK